MCVADISPAGAMNEFRSEYPDRFINTGVAEQSMIVVHCAGLAMGGYQPFAYTIATFAVFRPFEFIRDDICYQNLPVTIVGIGGGVTYSTLGATHHAMEDVNLLKSVPNIEIFTPSDPFEVEAITRHRCLNPTTPAYIRLGKAGEKNLSSNIAFEVGAPRHPRNGTKDCVVGYGPIMRMAVEVSDELSAAGRSLSVIAFNQIKPINSKAISEILENSTGLLFSKRQCPLVVCLTILLGQKIR